MFICSRINGQVNSDQTYPVIENYFLGKYNTESLSISPILQKDTGLVRYNDDNGLDACRKQGLLYTYQIEVFKSAYLPNIHIGSFIRYHYTRWFCAYWHDKNLILDIDNIDSFNAFSQLYQNIKPADVGLLYIFLSEGWISQIIIPTSMDSQLAKEPFFSGNIKTQETNWPFKFKKATSSVYYYYIFKHSHLKEIRVSLDDTHKIKKLSHRNLYYGKVKKKKN